VPPFRWRKDEDWKSKVELRRVTNAQLRIAHDEGILVLHPEEPLEVADFISITSQVDTYLAGHGKLHGVLIHAKSFPVWKDFAALRLLT